MNKFARSVLIPSRMYRWQSSDTVVPVTRLNKSRNCLYSSLHVKVIRSFFLPGSSVSGLILKLNLSCIYFPVKQRLSRHQHNPSNFLLGFRCRPDPVKMMSDISSALSNDSPDILVFNPDQFREGLAYVNERKT